MSTRTYSVLLAIALTATFALPVAAQGQAGQTAPSYAQPVPVPPAKGTAKRQPLFRHTSIDSAWKAAQKSGKPVLLFVTSKRCHYCDKMKAETWAHPQIAQAVAAQFEPVAVLKEKDPQIVKQLGIRAYPTTLVVSPKGELAGHLRGFANPEKFHMALLAPKNRVSAAQPATVTGR